MGNLNHEWKPRVRVELRYERWAAHRLRMLVDSGSDISIIGHSQGIGFGFRHDPADQPTTISGLGGTVEGFRRNATMTIAGHTFEAPILWAQVDNVPAILGREVVFDLFDIEFRQADRRVIFRWRRVLWRWIRKVLGG